MNDNEIIELFFARSESAITETQAKYGAYCRYIAHNILFDNQDAEECENDTYLKAWNSIPPHRPSSLSAFLGRITRNLALNKLKARNTQKRGQGECEMSLDELSEIIGTEDISIEENQLSAVIDRFLEELPKEKRLVFVGRYWYFDSIKTIASKTGFSEGKIKMMLKRVKNELKEFLEEEGVCR